MVLVPAEFPYKLPGFLLEQKPGDLENSMLVILWIQQKPSSLPTTSRTGPSASRAISAVVEDMSAAISRIDAAAPGGPLRP
ncbi:MAG: hypothetical protein ACOC78_02195 [Actinomycetota bacterium]